MRDRNQNINEQEETNDIFYKKLKNKNKSKIIQIKNKKCKILGHRKKYLKTEYAEGEYLEICPVNKMPIQSGEFEISIPEKWYERKYKCTQFRKWENYNSFWIKREWTYVEINLSTIENLETFYNLYSKQLNLPEFFGKNLDAFYDSSWGISFIPDEIEFTNPNLFKLKNEIEFSNLIEVINRINLEKNIKMTITNNR